MDVAVPGDFTPLVFGATAEVALATVAVGRDRIGVFGAGRYRASSFTPLIGSH